MSAGCGPGFRHGRGNVRNGNEGGAKGGGLEGNEDAFASINIVATVYIRTLNVARSSDREGWKDSGNSHTTAKEMHCRKLFLCRTSKMEEKCGREKCVPVGGPQAHIHFVGKCQKHLSSAHVQIPGPCAGEVLTTWRAFCNSG